MSFKLDNDPVTNRWSILLLDEPGRPRIEADTPELLEQFWNDVIAGNIERERKTTRSGAA